MARVIFGDVVRRANTKEDKDNTEKEFYVGGEHVDSNEVLVTKRGLIAGSTIGPMFYFGFHAGQVLFVSRNPHLRKAGMVTFDGICSEKTFVLETADEDVLLQRYLPFIMQSEHFWSYLEANKSGSVNYFTNWSTLAKYEFELPNIVKQQELSDLLWAMDATKRSYQKLLQKTDELVKAQFVEMFGEKSVMAHAWKVSPVDKVVEKPMSGEWGKDDLDGTGIRVLRTTNFTDQGVIDYSDVVTRKIDEKRAIQKYMKNGDILIEKSGGSDTKPVGRVVFYDEKENMFLFNNFTSVIRVKPGVELLPRYLFEFLFINYWSDGTRNFENKTTGIHNLKLADYLAETTIPLAPMKYQEQFSSLMKQSDKARLELERALAELSATYKMLITENLG